MRHFITAILLLLCFQLFSQDDCTYIKNENDPFTKNKVQMTTFKEVGSNDDGYIEFNLLKVSDGKNSQSGVMSTMHLSNYGNSTYCLDDECILYLLFDDESVIQLNYNVDLECADVKILDQYKTSYVISGMYEILDKHLNQLGSKKLSRVRMSFMDSSEDFDISENDYFHNTLKCIE